MTRTADLDTPALLIDLDILEANLTRVASYAREHGLRLRPHTKTHKIPALGRRQLELGAAGLTVAKVSEAEVMLRSGTPDLLIAYPLIGAQKLARLAPVARETAVTVSVDSLAAAQGLSDMARGAGVEIGILAEIDAGLGRVGVPPTEIVELSRAIARLPHLRLDGLAYYPGHIKKLDDEGQKALEEVSRLTQSTVEMLARAGLPPRIVSAGSTPTLFESHRVAGVNEIRPGTYIFNDRNTIESGMCTLDQCAATVMVTVVSAARPGHMVVDGGSKTFSSDKLANPADTTYGRIAEAPSAKIYKMNEEHGYVDLTGAERTQFAPGDRVRILPNHICVAMNLHERVYGVRGDVVEETWVVEGRGKLQ